MRRSLTELVVTELKVCGSTKNLRRGKEIHAQAVESGDASCILVANSLVHMYAKCRSMADAHQVFDAIRNPDVVSWNSLILGYAETGDGVTALELFARMRSQGCVPSFITFVAALKSCSSLAVVEGGRNRAKCLELGNQMHSEMSSHSNIFVQNTLIDMYVKCGSIAHARQVFDQIKHPDVVSWTALILGYAKNGEGFTALELFAKMKFEGCTPDRYTFVAALKACTCLTALEQDESARAECLQRGEQIHREIGSCLDIYVQSTLIDMYSKYGSMAQARQVFDRINHPNVVAWNALILGYADNGESITSLEMLARMRSQDCAPNSVTFLAVLKACGALGAWETGRKFHAEMRTDNRTEAVLVTSLVDFYAKCGDMVKAQEVFDLHCSAGDITGWTALLAGYSRLGDSDAVFGLLERMQDAGLQPDGVTCLCILTCCSHAGLVERASKFLKAMSATYGLTPTFEHYSCMIDILGRSNKLDDAMALLRSMSCKQRPVTWKTVLGACRKWKNAGVGRLAIRSLLSLEDTDAAAAAYVVMANIYGSSDMWEEQNMLLAMRKVFRAQKEQSYWTDEMGSVHSFGFT